MPDSDLTRITDLQALTSLPRLSVAERETLERLLWLAPEVALATASAAREMGIWPAKAGRITRASMAR